MGVYNSHAKEVESFKSQEDRFRQISSSYFKALAQPKAQQKELIELPNECIEAKIDRASV